MTKKLDERGMTNELSGSAFFKTPVEVQVDTKVAGNQATKTESKQPSNRDALQPSNHDTAGGDTEEVLLETVRLVVSWWLATMRANSLCNRLDAPLRSATKQL